MITFVSGSQEFSGIRFLAPTWTFIRDAVGNVEIQASGSGGGGGGVTDHGALTGLADDDHSQYLKVLGVNVVSTSMDIDILDDVNYTTNPGTGQVLMWDGPNQYWEPTTLPSVDHGGLSGLADDDHSQYLRTDGTRALGASWNAGQNITSSFHGGTIAGSTDFSINFNANGGTAGVLRIRRGSGAGTVIGEMDWSGSLTIDKDFTFGNITSGLRGGLSSDGVEVMLSALNSGQNMVLQVSSSDKIELSDSVHRDLIAAVSWSAGTGAPPTAAITGTIFFRF